MRARTIVLGLAAAIVLLVGLRLTVFSKRTLPIEGVVTDAKTGAPLEKVVVTVDWAFQKPNLFDSTGWGEGYRTVTDAQGRFQVPAKRTTMLVSRFDMQTVAFFHPLYERKRQVVFRANPDEYAFGSVQAGKVVMPLGLLTLEDRFSRPEDNSELATFFSSIRPDYFLDLRDKYGVRYDLNAILAKWEHLATRYPQGTQRNGANRIQWYFPRLRFQMLEAMKVY